MQAYTAPELEGRRAAQEVVMVGEHIGGRWKVEGGWVGHEMQGKGKTSACRRAKNWIEQVMGGGRLDGEGVSLEPGRAEKPRAGFPACPLGSVHD